MIDSFDKKIIDLMQLDATISNALIGKKIGLSSSAVNERIRKLKKNGVIRSIVALIDAEAIDKELCAFIYVLTDTPSNSTNFINTIFKCENVLECHHIAGEYSYLIKIRVKNTSELETFITNKLKSIEGITRTFTQIVLSTPKEQPAIIKPTVRAV